MPTIADLVEAIRSALAGLDGIASVEVIDETTIGIEAENGSEWFVEVTIA